MAVVEDKTGKYNTAKTNTKKGRWRRSTRKGDYL
jgi:hypothetical protein